MSKSSRWLGGLFLFGAAVHLIGLRIIAHWEYPPAAVPNGVSPWFVNYPLTNIGVALLGGIFVVLMMRRSILDGAKKNIDRTRLVLLSGARAIAATWLVIQTLFVCAAIALFAYSLHWT